MHTQYIILIVSFLCGQGSILFTQTYLITDEKYEAATLYGLAFVYITLSYWIVDFGSHMTLAKSALSRPASSLRFMYFNLSAIRLCIAIILVTSLSAFSLIYQITYGTNDLLTLLAIASIGTSGAAFSPAGIFDGLGKSGVSGVSSAIPTLLFSASILVFEVNSIAYSEFYVGILYAIAQISISIMQLFILWKIDRSVIELKRKTINQRRIAYAAQASSTFFLNQLPGQLLPRAQLFLANIAFDAQTIAIFLYARQISNGFTTFVELGARAGLARIYAEITGSNATIKYPLEIIVIPIVGAAAMICLALFLSNDFYTSTIYVAHIPLMLSSSYLILTRRAMIYSGNQVYAFKLTIMVSLVNIILCALSINWVGIVSIIIFDVVSHLIQIWAFRKRFFAAS